MADKAHQSDFGISWNSGGAPFGEFSLSPASALVSVHEIRVPYVINYPPFYVVALFDQALRAGKTFRAFPAGLVRRGARGLV